MAINILVGNIGSGKSLIASKLVKQFGGINICMDTIQQMVAGGVYGNYDPDKKNIYHIIEESGIRAAIEKRLPIIVDRTNMDRKSRERFIRIGKENNCRIFVYNFGPGDDSCLNRRLCNPKGIPKKVWADVFQNLFSKYEKPTYDEGIDEIIEIPDKYHFYAFDFDGTIVENKFPEIGEILNGTVEKLNKLYQELSNIVIIWTCRTGDLLNEMNKFLIDKKIPFDFINENPMFLPESRKIFAHEYYDDRNMIVSR